jgi:hypothetical protein
VEVSIVLTCVLAVGSQRLELMVAAPTLILALKRFSYGQMANKV